MKCLSLLFFATVLSATCWGDIPSLDKSPRIESIEEIKIEAIYRKLDDVDEKTMLDLARHIFRSNKISFDEEAYKETIKKYNRTQQR